MKQDKSGHRYIGDYIEFCPICGQEIESRSGDMYLCDGPHQSGRSYYLYFNKTTGQWILNEDW